MNEMIAAEPRLLTTAIQTVAARATTASPSRSSSPDGLTLAGYSRTAGGRVRSNMWTVSRKRTSLDR